jgi:hypothetical protein
MANLKFKGAVGCSGSLRGGGVAAGRVLLALIVWDLLVFLAIIFLLSAGCSSFVGNSPEEKKHRQEMLEQGQNAPECPRTIWRVSAYRLGGKRLSSEHSTSASKVLVEGGVLA